MNSEYVITGLDYERAPETSTKAKALQGCQVLAGFGEFALFHAFTHVVMHEGTLRIPTILIASA